MQKVDVKKGEGCELGVREERALRSSAAPLPGQSWGSDQTTWGFNIQISGPSSHVSGRAQESIYLTSPLH